MRGELARSILLNAGSIRKNRVWEFDLSELLKYFMDYQISTGRLDLKQCATAALSSSLVYRLKVESLFLFERLVRERKASVAEGPPGILAMPLRFGLASSTVGDLMDALQSIFDKILSETQETGMHGIEAQPATYPTEDFMTKVMNVLEPFRKLVLEALEHSQQFMLSEFLKGMGTIDAVRIFILLLFLGSDGLLELVQEGEDLKVMRRSR